MELWEREYQVARIVAGTCRVRSGGRTYVAGVPSRECRLLAAEVRRDALAAGRLEGLLSREEAVGVLLTRGLWTAEMDAERAKLDAAVEDMKVGLYENWSRSEARRSIRKALAIGRAELARLEGVRASLDHATCEVAAESAAARFLVGCSLRLPGGTPYWPDPWAGWERPDDPVVGAAMAALAAARLPEAGVRELARTDPWRSTWSARRACGGGVLGGAAADLTDEQRALCLWSSAYDSVREHPECPPDGVLEDDDVLDGWMAVQRRKREGDLLRRRADDIKNDKIRNAGEVFLLADTAEDARRVDRLNDDAARHRKAQRLSHLKRHGTVAEQDMPDSRLRMLTKEK